MPTPRGLTPQKIVYEISKSFDFIEVTLISGEFTDFIEITLIIKSRKYLHTTSVNSDIFATCTCHISLHECSRKDMWNLLGEAQSEASLRASLSGFYMSSHEHSCKLMWQVQVAKMSKLTLVVCKHLRDFAEILYIVDWFLISALACGFSLMKMILRF